MNRIPTEPGYYWAKLKTPSGGMIYGVPGGPIRIEPEMNDDGSCAWASLDWEVVEVWENGGDPDDDEYLAVNVPGIPVTQWRLDFYWGPKLDITPPTN